MTLDPILLLKAELAADQRWRPCPFQFVQRIVRRLKILKSSDIGLYLELYGICDDAGTVMADNKSLAIRMGNPSLRPRRALERMAEAKLLDLYEVDGTEYASIRSYSELVGLQRKAQPIYPEPPPRTLGDTPRHTSGDTGVGAIHSPPTPPSGDQTGEGESADRARARGPRLVAQEGKPVDEPERRRVAALAADGQVDDDGQLPLVPDEKPMSQSLARVLHAFVRAHGLVKAHLDARGQRLPPPHVIRHELERLQAAFGIRAVREGLRRVEREARGGTLTWWQDPLGNLSRKVEWAWRDAGGQPECEEEGPPQSAEGQVADSAEPSKIPWLTERMLELAPEGEARALIVGRLSRASEGCDPYRLAEEVDAEVEALLARGLDDAGLADLKRHLVAIESPGESATAREERQRYARGRWLRERAGVPEVARVLLEG